MHAAPLPLLALLAAAWAASALPLSGISTVVTTQYGQIRGVIEVESGVKVVSFYNVPYAAPPVGARRFRPPVAHDPWPGVLSCEADQPANVCPQLSGSKVQGNEDCLYANIYVPYDAAMAGPLASLLWIYGGGFEDGDGYLHGEYSGRHLAAKRGLIVAEFNYRLGALGFLSLPEFMSESGTTGGFGTQDQTFALQFVYNNIASFGGDPKRIAIFGESAGGFSVCWHLANKASAGLFSAAIMQSGSCQTREFFFDLNSSYEYGHLVAEAVGCGGASGSDVLDCMRAVNVTNLLNFAWPSNGTIPPLAPSMNWGPVIDGTSQGLTDLPINLIKAGTFNRVPVIMGTNKDEGSVLLPIISKAAKISYPVKDSEVEVFLAHFFNATTSALIQSMYPAQNFKSPDDRLAMVLRDFFFLCPTRNAVRAISGFDIPAYLYHFDYAMTNWPDYRLLGDYHMSEIPLVFDNSWPAVVHAFTPEEQRLADTFTLYWSNLAKLGTPNAGLGPDQVFWPRYNATADMNVFLEVPARVGAHLNQTACDLWDTILPVYK